MPSNESRSFGSAWPQVLLRAAVVIVLATLAAVIIATVMSFDETDEQGGAPGTASSQKTPLKKAFSMLENSSISSQRHSREQPLNKTGFIANRSNPKTAPHSRELDEIIASVKKGHLLKVEKNTTDSSQNPIPPLPEEITKASTPSKASEVPASPALEAVLKALRNGSFSFPGDFEQYSAEMVDPFYMTYTETDPGSIYDLTVLKSGKDIFLSLGYKTLTQADREDSAKSQKLDELRQTIEVLDQSAKSKGNGTEVKDDLDRKRALIRAKVARKKKKNKSILEFFGVRRKGEESDYEDLARSYRNYKRWTKRMEKLEQRMRKKRRKKILSHSPKRQSDYPGYTIPEYGTISPKNQIRLDSERR